jgi:hypothetical protein
MKKFKYNDELHDNGCDLSQYSERSRNAFRWTFESITDPKNFLPVNINRVRDECIGWGLSFFESEETAKTRFNEIKSNTPNFGKKVGNFISNGKLEIEDGISDDANRHGHFTHFEYENIDLTTKFTVITKI